MTSHFGITVHNEYSQQQSYNDTDCCLKDKTVLILDLSRTVDVLLLVKTTTVKVTILTDNVHVNVL